MPIDKNLVLRVLQSARGKELKLEDVVLRAALPENAKKEVRTALESLVKEGKAVRDGGRFAIAPPPAEEAPKPARPAPTAAKAEETTGRTPDQMPVLPRRPQEGRRELVGTITIHRDGYGFLAQLYGGEDLFIPPQAISAADALDGDLVEALPGPGRDGRPIAREIRVIERRRQFAVGTYRSPELRGEAYIEPRDTALGEAILVRPRADLKDGDVVRVKLGERRGPFWTGEVVTRLGQPGDPNVEVLSVAYSEGFADLFPPDAKAQAEETPDHVREQDLVGRRDLRTLDLITIDGEDARDFDDAIFVERTKRGWRLVVAIADVTHYVTPGSALDREAIRRATSVYFPQHVLPMLPERLSNGICSLNPRVDRLCMVADMALDDEGRPLDTDIYAGVMNSRVRCTYTQVAEVLEGKPVPALDPVRDMVGLAGELASRLTKARIGRGAIDFDMAESYIKLGPDGEVAAIEKRARNPAHRLIEEFMLAANETVARYFETRGLPTVYRVHGQPKEDKLEQFVTLAAAFGHEVRRDRTGNVTSAALNEFLHRVEGRPEQKALNNLLLRSMMQAVYSSDNIGHFGLAAPSYLHFTSPIRRYPDLIVHRLLKQHWARGGRMLADKAREEEASELEATAVHCSERERAATNAEREIDAFYAASFMTRHVGDRFPGVIASVAEFGLFVELGGPWVEGLVRAESIGAEPRFDEERHRLVFGKNRSFGVGDKVEIEVERASPLTRRIDFLLVDNGKVVKAAGADERPQRRPAARAERRPATREAPRGGKGGGPRGAKKDDRKGGGKKPPPRRGR